MNDSLNLRVVNISLKNAIMPKEFYWNELQINRLSEAFEKTQPVQSQNLQIFAPKMPLGTPPLQVTFHIRNLSSTERELKTFKKLLCDCSLKRNRLRKKGVKPKCEHKGIIEMRPTFVRVGEDETVELEMTCRYDVLGQQEVHLVMNSSTFTIKLQIFVTTLEFDPAAMLISNQLTPVAINLFPAPQQNLWLYNPYSTDINLRLISKSEELVIANEEIVVQSHQHSPLFITFTPKYVGFYVLKIEIVFNGCRIPSTVHGQCTERAQDTLAIVSRNKSPNYDLNSKLNPFVLYNANLHILLAQNGLNSENLVALQNNSNYCIKFEWPDFIVSAGSCEITMTPKSGFLKAGSTKLFRVSAKSFGLAANLQMIPIKCAIFRYHKEQLREYSLPDGYFEYTDKGYYEKPSNWSPNCLEFIQSLYLNANIRVLNTHEIIKYAASMLDEGKGASFCLEALLLQRKQHLKILPSIAVCENDVNDDENCVNFLQPKCETGADEEHAIETLISLILHGSKYEQRQKAYELNETYESICKGLSQNNASQLNAGHKAERKLLIPHLINDVLFECIGEIAKEHRFIPPTW